MDATHPLARALLGAAFALLCVGAGATEISLLSGGAVEPGLLPALRSFEAATGHSVKVTFNAAPRIASRVAAGEAWDAVIAPLGVLDKLAKEGRIGPERSVVGRVGVGVAVRPGSPVPELGSEAALREALLAAEAVVINRASTGQLVEAMLQRLGMSAAIEPKLQRESDGAAVMEHLLAGRGRELGFGAITEILLFRERGLRFVGPLPPSLQSYTTYAAAVPASSGHADVAQLLLRHLAEASVQAGLAAAGVEPVR